MRFLGRHGTTDPARGGVAARARGFARSRLHGLRAYGAALRRPEPPAAAGAHALRMAAFDTGHAVVRGLRWVGTAMLSPLVAPDPPPRSSRGRLARSAPTLLWIAAVLLFFAGIPAVTDSYHMTVGWAYIWSALTALPLGLARRTPLLAWRLAAAMAVVTPVVAPPLDAATLPWPPTLAGIALAACVAVALRHHWRTVVATWAWTVAVMAWGLSRVRWEATTGMQLQAATMLVAVVLLVAYLVGARGEMARRLDEGERLRRETEMQRAILEERTRIARELHDVVAHHMSMISVQAETAPFRAPDLGEQGRASMADIAATAREALVEMRRLLGVLRDDEAEAEHEPQPGLAQLDQLVAGAQRAGLTVELAVTGEPRALPPGAELSAYRIVQEGLSNAAWHAPNARVRVTLDHSPSLLRVQVHNGPPPVPQAPSSAGRGHGLLGMRERVALHGGTLDAGPTGDGGYRIDATLPLRDQGPQE